MDPLRSVNKAYLMTFRVEIQQEVRVAFGESIGMSVYLFVLKIIEGMEMLEAMSREKKILRKVKGIAMQKCPWYICFKLYGYPERYKNLNNQKAKNPVNVLATCLDTLIHVDGDKNKAPINGNYINFAHG